MNRINLVLNKYLNGKKFDRKPIPGTLIIQWNLSIFELAEYFTANQIFRNRVGWLLKIVSSCISFQDKGDGLGSNEVIDNIISTTTKLRPEQIMHVYDDKENPRGIEEVFFRSLVYVKSIYDNVAEPDIILWYKYFKC